jgi:membrane protease YdiL (CAAX protease family)
LNQNAALSKPFNYRSIFVGPSGIRAGWSALIFVAIFFAVGATSTYILSLLLRGHTHPNTTDLSPLSAVINEVILFVSWLVPAWAMSRIEHKPIFAYGYHGHFCLRRYFYGLLWGFISISALVLTLWKLGYLFFDNAIFTDLHSLEYAAAWGAVFLTVGFVEESLLRGYLQSTLTRGLGFWWAALILSCGFGGIHLTNPGESPIGIFSAGAVGLVFCLSLWHTGSLWWAIGFHAAWDWGESYFYGTADSGLVSHGRLFTEHPSGGLYWSGGATGPEGSVLVLVLLALIAIGMHLWWGKRTVSPYVGNGWKPLRPVQPK